MLEFRKVALMASSGVTAMGLLLASPPARLKRFGPAAALALFAGGLILAISSAPEAFVEIAAGPFLMLLATVPAVVGLNAAEFQVMAAYSDVTVRWPRALTVSIYTGAANMLPLPGGVLTRVAALHACGVPLKTGSMLAVLLAGVWGGMTFLYAGVWLIHLEHPGAAAGFVLGGLALLVPALAALFRISCDVFLLAALLAVRLLILIVDTLRVLLAIQTVGVAASFAQASLFGVPGFVATAAMILPGGLGLQEGLSALIAPLAGISGAVGFVAISVLRVSFIGGLACMAVVMLGTLRGGRTPAQHAVRPND